MSIKKTIPFLFCAILMAVGPFLSGFKAGFKPPAQYTITLSANGINALFQAVGASNGIPGEQRVQLLQAMQDQIIQQNKDWAIQDSLMSHKKKP